MVHECCLSGRYEWQWKRQVGRLDVTEQIKAVPLDHLGDRLRVSGRPSLSTVASPLGGIPRRARFRAGECVLGVNPSSALTVVAMSELATQVAICAHLAVGDRSARLLYFTATCAHRRPTSCLRPSWAGRLRAEHVWRSL